MSPAERAALKRRVDAVVRAGVDKFPGEPKVKKLTDVWRVTTLAAKSGNVGLGPDWQ